MKGAGADALFSTRRLAIFVGVASVSHASSRGEVGSRQKNHRDCKDRDGCCKAREPTFAEALSL